mmetsp:Transcript_39947/g.58336  ORF Transcript_39947/g.58336 Transcript_39947/m.58336 type:complete len:403 (-) Transcript_39947:72-1280(-)
MSESNLFKLLDFDPWDDGDRERVDTYAIIKKARQTPRDVDLMYTFSKNALYKRLFPLHQAILLGLNVEVIDVLSSPVAVKRKCNGATALHIALGFYFKSDQGLNASKDVVALLLRKYPDAAKEKDSEDKTPLQIALENKAPLDVLSLLLHIWPDAAKEKGRDGRNPIHFACRYGSSLDVMFVLLSGWPDAAKQKTKYGGTPLHLACQYGAPLNVVSALLSSFPDAAREKEVFGRTPLHLACLFGSPLDVMSALLSSFPDALQQKERRGNTPLHLACRYKASMDVIQLLLDEWLKATENRNKHSVESLRSLASGKTKRLLFYVSSLFNEEQSNPSPGEIMRIFININWWNGAMLVISRYPAVTKSLDLDIKVMADFLSIVGKRCSLTTMSYLIQNEPDLLEGV